LLTAIGLSPGGRAMKVEMPDFAPEFISHNTNGRSDIYEKILPNTVTNFVLYFANMCN